jgi:hypothetical protein
VRLAAFVALIAAASAVVRSANLTASNEPLGLAYAVPLLLAMLLAVVAVKARAHFGDKARPFAVIAAGVAVAIISTTTVAGARSLTLLWNAAYLQWSLRIPVSTVGLDKHILASSKVAVGGMRSCPLVGPTLARRTYDNVIIESPAAWLAALRQSGVTILAAAGESGAPDQPGYLQPLPVETWISQDMARDRGLCAISTHGYVRIYGLSVDVCSATLRPAKHR